MAHRGVEAGPGRPGDGANDFGGVLMVEVVVITTAAGGTR